MKCGLYTLCTWLVSTTLAFSQAMELPAPPPLPTGFHGGSYLLLNSSTWQPAKLRYNGVPELLVQDAEHKGDSPLVLQGSQVQAFAIGRDTFDVVHNLTAPGVQPITTAFARRLFRGGGFLVSEYVLYRHQPDPAIPYRLLLDRPGGKTVAVLPLQPVLFRRALAPALHDFQALSSQLELDPSILPVQLPELLAAYGRWKQAQANPVTAK